VSKDRCNLTKNNEKKRGDGRGGGGKRRHGLLVLGGGDLFGLSFGRRTRARERVERKRGKDPKRGTAYRGPIFWGERQQKGKQEQVEGGGQYYETCTAK